MSEKISSTITDIYCGKCDKGRNVVLMIIFYLVISLWEKLHQLTELLHGKKI